MCKEKLGEVGDGGVVAKMWLVDEEGIAEVSGEGVGESSGKVVWGEVGFKIFGKDMCYLRGKVVADAVEFNREMAREG